MDPISLAKTIYLGDSGIIAIFLDTSKNIVKLKIDAIQRNSINNKASEQLLNSWIVFENVDSFAISPSGFLPDDFIEIENIAEVGTGKYEITFFQGVLLKIIKLIAALHLKIVLIILLLLPER